MTPEKKKQFQTLGALVVLLAIAGTYAYMSMGGRPSAPKVSPAEKAARVAALPAAGNAQIRLDLLLGDKTDRETVGKRNVFQYYVPPPPPKPVQTVVVQPPPPPRPIVINSGPATPPTPPSALSTFKYDGVGIVAKPGKLMASISNGPVERYNVTEGEYILGRYRVNRITEGNVEIEDLDQNRRQTYNRITQ